MCYGHGGREFLVFPFFLLFTSCCLVLGLLTVFTCAAPSLVHAETATDAFFTPAPHSLVLAEATAAAVFTRAPPHKIAEATGRQRRRPREEG